MLTPAEMDMVKAAVDAVHAALDRGETRMHIDTPFMWTRGDLAFENAVVERLDIIGRLKSVARAQPC